MSKYILFIDDDPDFLYVLERACRSVDAISKVETAKNGKEAIDFLDSCVHAEALLPDLMFIDINMPIMNGFEFLDLFKDRREEFERLKKIIPIVMLTSSEHEEDREKALGTGVVDRYVVKPSDASGVEQVIRDLVEN